MQSATSSFVRDIRSAVFHFTLFAGVLIVSLAILIGDIFLAVLITWGICAIVFAALAFVMVWHLRIRQFSLQPSSPDVEVAQYILEGSESCAVEPATRSTKRALDQLPVYRTPLEMLNQIQASTEGEESDQGVQVITATVVESSEDDYTFATSPFTSPPIYTMEIFVSKEETVYHDEEHIDATLPTPSPFELEQDDYVATRPAMLSRELTKLVQLCEISITESNMRDTQLL